MGLRFRSEFRDIEDRLVVLEISDDGWSGDVLSPRLAGNGVEIEDGVPDKMSEPVTGSTASISFYDDGEFDDFAVNGVFQCEVTVRREGTLLWRGYLSPEVYDLPIFNRPETVRMNADSCMAIMGKRKIKGDGTFLPSFAQIIGECLDDCRFGEGVVAFDEVAFMDGISVVEPYSMFDLCAMRRLWAEPEVNDSDETEDRVDYSAETWSDVVGSILRYFGLTMREDFENDRILLCGLGMSYCRLIVMSRSEFVRTGSGRSYSVGVRDSVALDSLLPGGTDNRMSNVTAYGYAKVHADIKSFPTPAMIQSSNQRTEIIIDSIDMRMKDTLTGAYTTRVMSGQVRNCGSSDAVYADGDVRGYVFYPDASDVREIADLMSVPVDDYVVTDDEGWKILDIGGAFPMRSVSGLSSDVDQMKNESEYQETLVMHVQCGSWSIGGALLPAGRWIAEWKEEGVTLTGDFAFSLSYRIFTNDIYSMDDAHPDQYTDAFFWMETVDGEKKWWNGESWQDDQVLFHPEFENTESYPSATVKTVYPEGKEYVDLSGVVMEHGSEMGTVVAFGCGLAVTEAWRNAKSSVNDTRISECFVRDWEVGVGSNRKQYAINKYTGEPKEEYNYKSYADVDNGNEDGIEEDFPFHSYNRTQLSLSCLLIDDRNYETASFWGPGVLTDLMRHEVWLARLLSVRYGSKRRRYTIEVKGSPSRCAVFMYGGMKLMETGRSYDVCDDVTKLTCEELVGTDVI